MGIEFLEIQFELKRRLPIARASEPLGFIPAVSG